MLSFTGCVVILFGLAGLYGYNNTVRNFYEMENRNNRIAKNLQSCFIIPFDDDVIVALGDIDKTGCLDCFYVHSDYQGKGIATAICNQLEAAVQGSIVTHASITARSFFKNRGYKVIKEQQVVRQGISLTNFIMEKCK